VKKKKKSFNLHFIKVGDSNQTAEVVRKLVKERLEMVLAKNGAVAHNLDEVLQKYITGEMSNEQNR